MMLEVVESKIDIGKHSASEWFLVKESFGEGENLCAELTHIDDGTRVDVYGQIMFDVLFSSLPDVK